MLFLNFFQFIIFYVIISSPLIVFSQNTGELDMTDYTDDFYWGFGCPLSQFSKIGSDNAFSLGGEAAIVLNKNFYVGGYGLAVSNSIRRDLVTDSFSYKGLSVGLSHYGPWLGYVNNLKKPVHFGASTRLGYGHVSLIEKAIGVSYYKIVRDRIYTFSPQAELEINIAYPVAKLNIGLGYLFVFDVNNPAFKTKDLNTPYISATLMFGLFGEPK